MPERQRPSRGTTGLRASASPTLLGQNRNTVLKASYAHFVDALGTTTIAYTNPIGAPSYAYYPWHDDGDLIVEAGEVDTSVDLLEVGQRRTASTVSANVINPDVKAGSTNEFIAGLDQEIAPGFALGAAYTYRKYINPIVGLPFDAGTGRILTNADYVQYATLTGSLPDGTPYGPVPVYGVDPAVLATLTDGIYPSGQYYTNREDYNQAYSGVDLTLTKRLSNRWMARASFSYGINNQHVGPDGCPGDPNNGPLYVASLGFFESPVQTTLPRRRLRQPAVRGSGSHQSVFLNAKYVYNVNAMYQLPLTSTSPRASLVVRAIRSTTTSRHRRQATDSRVRSRCCRSTPSGTRP